MSDKYNEAWEDFIKTGIYRPPTNGEPKAQNATLAVKFSNDLFLMKSFLDQQNIEYQESELEDSPLGRGIRIKREPS